MLTSTTVDGLQHSGSASTTRGTSFFQPLPWRQWYNNPREKLLSVCPFLCRRKAIETKLRQNMVFDPGGYSGRLCCYLFWESGANCFVGGFAWDAVMETGAGACFIELRTASSYSKKGKQFTVLYYCRSVFPQG